MADIFISYSSKDRVQAEQLTELLASAGLSVWIDKQGIDVATSWSEEIVHAIDGCRAFVVMLSPSSVTSHNVIKEVSLASEKKKKILPLDLEPVEIPASMQYALAGLQRAPMTNIDSIIRALGKRGLEATQAPTMKLVKETDARKSLMILPFEDLSPTADNQWFADGIVSELISALSHITSLRMIDIATTKEFKTYRGHLTTYAKEMSIRYFVQGDVRKFGDNIKITARLLDIDTGDYLWQDSLKATMSDIFDVQESVADKVVNALELHLSREEQQQLTERGTANTEAYELYLKADEYFQRQTKDGILLSGQLLAEAITLDPAYADAYRLKGLSLFAIYRDFDPDPQLLIEAESLCQEALRLKPELYSSYHVLSQIYSHQGRLSEAEATAREYIRNAPDQPLSHVSLATFYSFTGQHDKEVAAFEEAVRLNPYSRVTLLNLVISCNSANQKEKCAYWSLQALPLAERHLKLNPDDEISRTAYAIFLCCCGRIEDARREALVLKDSLDGNILYNTACLFAILGDMQGAIITYRKAIDRGCRNIPLLRGFLHDKEQGIGEIADTPEHDELSRIIDELERSIEVRNNG